MGPKLKKYLITFLVVFLVYAVFKNPQEAANLVRGAFDGILAIVAGIGRFFDALLAG